MVARGLGHLHSVPTIISAVPLQDAHSSVLWPAQGVNNLKSHGQVLALGLRSGGTKVRARAKNRAPKVSATD